MRWAELRNDGSGWSVHQSGTYAPADGNHRCIGSIAMEQAGNIAVGYSVSGSGTFPSVRYVTRNAEDPLGTLPGGPGDRHPYRDWLCVERSKCRFWNDSDGVTGSGRNLRTTRFRDI